MANQESQEKKRWLSRYRELVETANAYCKQAGEWYDRAVSTTKPLTGLPRASSPPRTDECYAKYMDCVSVSSEYAEGASKAMRQIRDAIEAVSDEKCRELLTHRYISGLKWYEIAGVMQYDQRWILKLHGKALGMVDVKHATKRHPET